MLAQKLGDVAHQRMPWGEKHGRFVYVHPWCILDSCSVTTLVWNASLSPGSKAWSCQSRIAKKNIFVSFGAQSYACLIRSQSHYNQWGLLQIYVDKMTVLVSFPFQNLQGMWVLFISEFWKPIYCEVSSKDCVHRQFCQVTVSASLCLWMLYVLSTKQMWDELSLS